jgi:hypothetical protein
MARNALLTAATGCKASRQRSTADQEELVTDQRWAPAEQQVPELLENLMHMGSVEYSGNVIQQYKHVDTRRYINLDGSGQAWQIAVHPDTGELAARRIDLDEAKALVLR